MIQGGLPCEITCVGGQVLDAYCIVLYLSISIALLTVGTSHSTVLSEALQPQQLTLCRSLHAEALQATVSEGLAQRSLRGG